MYNVDLSDHYVAFVTKIIILTTNGYISYFHVLLMPLTVIYLSDNDVDLSDNFVAICIALTELRFIFYGGIFLPSLVR